MRTSLIAGTAGALLVLVLGAAPQRPAASPRPVAQARTPILALVWRGGQYRLARVDPVTLKPVSRRLVPLGAVLGQWARSPGGRRVAVVSRRMIRIVDLRRMRVVRTIFGAWDDMNWLAWPAPGRILAVSGPTPRVEAIANGRIVWTRTLDGAVTDLKAMPGGVAMLLSPPDRIGTTTVAVVGADGSVRTATLDRIQSGFTYPQDSNEIGTVRWAGFAVDAAGTKAFVVPQGSTVAEVDLGTMAVAYHELSHPVSLLGRLHDWLEPRAAAKGANGTARRAELLGDGLLAVSGSDEKAWLDADGKLVDTSTPSGLQFVDTRSWTIRVVDGTTSGIEVDGGYLLATGGGYDTRLRSPEGRGLDVYGADGSLFRHLFGSSYVGWAQAENGLAYVWLGSGVKVVDLTSGAVVATPKIPANNGPQLLIP